MPAALAGLWVLLCLSPSPTELVIMYHVFEFVSPLLLDGSYAFELTRCKQGHLMSALHSHILNHRQHCCSDGILCV